MAAVVVDSCLTVKWAVVQDYTPEAHDLLKQWNPDGDDLFAPAIFRAEVASALYKCVHRGPGKPKPDTITLDEAKLLLAAVLGVVQVMPEDDALLERALDLAAAWNRPSAYDTLFAALAKRLGCDLWTADDKFHNAVSARCSWVRHIAGHTIAPPVSPQPSRDASSIHHRPTAASGPTRNIALHWPLPTWSTCIWHIRTRVGG